MPRSVTPLTIVALAWATGQLLGRALPGFYPFLIGLVIFLLLALVPRWRIPALLVAMVFAGAVRYHFPLPPHHLARILSSSTFSAAELQGEIASGADSLNYSERYRLRATALNGVPVTGTLLLTTHGPNLRPGDEITVTTDLQPLTVALNPAQPAWDDYSRGSGLAGFAVAQGLPRVTGHRIRPWSAFIAELRSICERQLDRLGPHAAFGKALVLGDSVPWDERQQNLADSGLAHLIAVSGMHVAIIALVFSTLLGWIIRRRNVERIIVIFLLLFYAALCRWIPSATRAVIMIDFYLIGLIIQRRMPFNHLLALAFLSITVIQPVQMFEAGFQLSFLGVFALANLIPKTGLLTDTEQLAATPWQRRRLRELELALVSSVILGLVLAPITLLHFHRFTLNAVVGNLLGIPLFGAMLPLVMLIMAVPGVCVLPLREVFDLLLQIFDGWVAFTAKLPFGCGFVPFTRWQFWGCVAGIGLTIFTLRRHRRMPLLGAGILLLICLLPWHHPMPPLRITFFDVGLGDSALIETPDVRILIDTGTTPAFHSRVIPYLRAHGLHHLDAVILSHAHDDHAGGVSELLQGCKVDRLIATPQTLTELRYQVTFSCPIDTLFFDRHYGNLLLRFYPPQVGATTDNDASLVVQVTNGGFSALFTGDLSETGEQELLDNPIQPVDLLKVAHHGSDTGTSPEFLFRVKPQAVVISTSEHNRYGFPSPATLQRLAPLGERVFVTGREGAVTVETDGKTIRMRGYRSGKTSVFNVREKL